MENSAAGGGGRPSAFYDNVTVDTYKGHEVSYDCIKELSHPGGGCRKQKREIVGRLVQLMNLVPLA